MTFSIIIPTHNDSMFLPNLLETISRQSFRDYETLLIADSCDEQNLKDAQRRAKMYGCRFFDVNVHNAGLARNVGLDNAIGDYVLFADADDRFLHEYVFEMIYNLVSRSNADMALFGFIFGKYGFKCPYDNNGNAFGNVWSRCWKRDAIGETRFPNVYPDDDLQFCNLMEEKPLKVAAFNAPIYYYNYLRVGSINWVEKKKEEYNVQTLAD